MKKNTTTTIPDKYKEIIKETSLYFSITLGGILGLILSLCIIARLFSTIP